MAERSQEKPTIAHLGIGPVLIGQVPVHPVTLSDTLQFMDYVIQEDQRAVIHYANAHAINLADRNKGFQKAMAEASLVFCDGKSLQWAAQLLGHSLPQRFTPPDWIDSLCSLAAKRHYGLFFLGGGQGVAEGAAKRLRKQHPNLSVETSHGYFERTSSAQAVLIAKINKSRPRILLVGLGMPEQELWVRRFREEIQVPVVITVGGMFDFVSGSKWRGPKWLTSFGLEWLTRLVTEPRRLGARYLLGNPRFLWSVVSQALAEGRGERQSRDRQ